MRTQCPKCTWSPTPESEWVCDACGFAGNLLISVGECSECRHIHPNIYCIEWEGGCGESSLLLDWFPDLDEGLSELNIERNLD